MVEAVIDEPIEVVHLQKLANQLIFNSAIVTATIIFMKTIKKFVIKQSFDKGKIVLINQNNMLTVKNIFQISLNILCNQTNKRSCKVVYI